MTNDHRNRINIAEFSVEKQIWIKLPRVKLYNIGIIICILYIDNDA